MGKVSVDDKMRIQTLREQGLGFARYRRIPREDTNCSDFIRKDEWPLNSADLNPLDYHVWGAMLEPLRDISTKAKYHRRAEESLANSMR